MKSLFLLSTCVGVLFSTAINAQDALNSMNNGPQPLFASQSMILESCSSTLPSGYLLSYRRDVTFCKGQKSYVYESYLGKPVGAYMDVCEQTLPAGWIVAAVHTGYTVCAPKKYWNIERIS